MVGMTTADMNRPHAPLVLGATGKSGRRVVAGLRRAGVEPTIGSRTPAGPHGRSFDWDDRSTWTEALRGADAAYLCFAPDLAVPGAAETVGDVAELAVRLGVGRLVLLSGRGEPEAQRAEDAVRTVAPEWGVVRAAWFAQNFSESFFLDGVLAGEVALPVGPVREPFVDAEDVADVATAALLGRTELCRVHEVTGPEALGFADAVAVIAAAIGRPVRFGTVDLAAYADGLRQAGLPGDAVELISYLFTEVLDGRNEHPTDGVLQALGRPARSFADYARATAATGAWGASTTGTRQ
jgi:uncharacterized protein YbjT (DUF2867 family)